MINGFIIWIIGFPGSIFNYIRNYSIYIYFLYEKLCQSFTNITEGLHIILLFIQIAHTAQIIFNVKAPLKVIYSLEEFVKTSKLNILKL